MKQISYEKHGYLTIIDEWTNTSYKLTREEAIHLKEQIEYEEDCILGTPSGRTDTITETL